MATPVAPTVSSILTEAFRRCGIPSPTPGQLLRAEQEWFEEAKRELTSEKRWHNLEETMVMIPQAYIQAYPLPSPLYRALVIRLYDGAVKGTATAGTSNTITLASGAGRSTLNGMKIFLTSGTGAAQVNRIISVSGDVATVACQWTTLPDPTSTYMIADYEHELNGPNNGLARTGLGASMPTTWEEYEQTLRFWPVPDQSTYALEIDGIVDVSLIDANDSRMTKLLREWRLFLLYAVMSKISDDNADKDDAEKYEQKAERAKLQLMREDSRRVRARRIIALRSPGGLPTRRTR